jgi:SNF2 family DNA or RNA helicase
VFDIAGRDPERNELLTGSMKLRVMLKLVRRMLAAEHRVLIFSQAKLMLDIIARVLLDRDIASVRIDGGVTGRDRQRVIDNFNAANEGSPSVCLLTTKACGVGTALRILP